MKKEDFEVMSADELEAHCAALRAQKEAIQAELREAVQALDDKRAAESARAKVAAMSPAERKALGIPEPQTVAPAGIESAEGFSK